MYIKFYNPKTQTLTLENKPCTFKGDIMSIIRSDIKFINTAHGIFRFQLQYLGWY